MTMGYCVIEQCADGSLRILAGGVHGSRAEAKDALERALSQGVESVTGEVLIVDLSDAIPVVIVTPLPVLAGEPPVAGTLESDLPYGAGESALEAGPAAEPLPGPFGAVPFTAFETSSLGVPVSGDAVSMFGDAFEAQATEPALESDLEEPMVFAAAAVPGIDPLVAEAAPEAVTMWPVDLPAFAGVVRQTARHLETESEPLVPEAEFVESSVAFVADDGGLKPEPESEPASTPSDDPIASADARPLETVVSSDGPESWPWIAEYVPPEQASTGPLSVPVEDDTVPGVGAGSWEPDAPEDTVVASEPSGAEDSEGALGPEDLEEPEESEESLLESPPLIVDAQGVAEDSAEAASAGSVEVVPDTPSVGADQHLEVLGAEPAPSTPPAADLPGFAASGEMQLDEYSCDDCVYTDACPRSGQVAPAECGAFQWRAN